MINADISNIWGDISLQDLLGLESRILEAHKALFTGTKQTVKLSGWMDLPDELPNELTKKANLIRMDSDILVVIGDNCATRGVRAIIELLQGPHRNLGKGLGDPMILFISDNISPTYWNDLTHLLADRDYSLCVMAGDNLSTESAIILRNLKWMLCRKYGTDYAMDRIYAATNSSTGTLGRMARAENWKVFDMDTTSGEDFSLLCPGCWLPLAVAGIDIDSLLRSARNARETYRLGSFDDNPAWLYTAARKLMAESGKSTQLLTSFEPGMAALGAWWQKLFAKNEDSPHSGMMPISLLLPQAHPLLSNSPHRLFETMIRFEAPEKDATIVEDNAGLDGLRDLEKKTLSSVQDDTFYRIQQDHADSGVGVITLECPPLCEETLGELLWFFQLSRALELMM